MPRQLYMDGPSLKVFDDPKQYEKVDKSHVGLFWIFEVIRVKYINTNYNSSKENTVSDTNKQD